MLILTRKIGETLVVGDNVKIKVLGVKGNQVRIGIEAPEEVKVHRKEIFDKIAAGIKPKKDIKTDDEEMSYNL